VTHFCFHCLTTSYFPYPLYFSLYLTQFSWISTGRGGVQMSQIGAAQKAIELHPDKPSVCTPEVAYAPRQCRHEVCFCVTLEGGPIRYCKVLKKLADFVQCGK
jgi:hypothetical protein